MRYWIGAFVGVAAIWAIMPEEIANVRSLLSQGLRMSAIGSATGVSIVGAFFGVLITSAVFRTKRTRKSLD